MWWKFYFLCEKVLMGFVDDVWIKMMMYEKKSWKNIEKL